MEKTSKARSDLFTSLEAYRDVLHVSAHKTTGPVGWYKEFLKSQRFQEMNNDSKDEVIDTFSSLMYLIELAAEVFPAE